MLQQRRAPGGLEVGLVLEDQPPVADVGQRGPDVALQPPGLIGGQERHRHPDRDQQDEQRRQQAEGPSLPERDHVEPLVSPPLGQQEGGDEEAADDEEHVDAEESAPGPRHVGVVGEHRRDGQGPQAVQRRKMGKSRPLAHGHGGIVRSPMEFQAVLQKRKMTRSFDGRPVDPRRRRAASWPPGSGLPRPASPRPSTSSCSRAPDATGRYWDAALPAGRARDGFPWPGLLAAPAARRGPLVRGRLPPALRRARQGRRRVRRPVVARRRRLQPPCSSSSPPSTPASEPSSSATHAVPAVRRAFGNP